MFKPTLGDWDVFHLRHTVKERHQNENDSMTPYIFYSLFLDLFLNSLPIPFISRCFSIASPTVRVEQVDSAPCCLFAEAAVGLDSF